ncbi:putative type I polyketide synthase domain protein [Mycobacterium kansasii]|uniref:Putative type I polyketide synthase domain protein n=1 Tax=Mycobacterium kansasii TaxID=1768 RepID=A0A1V3WD20_MYCKA|nr:putative type I polyketide synthase domain protein [Mycobacterium kansasii]
MVGGGDRPGAFGEQAHDSVADGETPIVWTGFEDNTGRLDTHHRLGVG